MTIDRRYRDLLILLAAAALMPIANGRWSVGAAAWIAPALLIRFLRAQPIGRAVLAGIVVMSGASFVWWSGIFPLSGIGYALASIAIGAFKFLPYLADRIVAPRLGPWTAAFVFPTACLAADLFDELAGPFGNWSSPAYTQSGNLALLQLLSITGLAGVTFLVTWFASAVQTRRGLMLYVPAIAVVLLWGGARLQAPLADESVRVAAITPQQPTYAVRGNRENSAIHAVLASIRSRRTVPEPEWAAFRQRANDINRELLAASERQARAGARIVVWSEGGGIVDARDERALIAHAGEVAHSTSSYLAVAYLVLDARHGDTYENKVTLVGPDRRALWSYHKTHPVPGMESCPAGDGRVPVTPTPHGRIASVICFDADFPALVRQAGRARADLLLIPADDWPEIDPRHAEMATFRAIEQGFSIVRSTTNGLSTAVDRYGRIHAAQNYRAGSRVLSVTLPRDAAPTVYTRVGDVFAWLGAIAFVVLFLSVSLRAFRQRRARVRPDRANTPLGDPSRVPAAD